MTIKDVKAFTLNLPLEKPIRTSNLTIRERDYVFVEVETSDGTKGHGFGFARGGLVGECVNANLKPLLLGESAWLTEKLWHDMYTKTRYLGRKGLMMRAISAVDIALWDLKGRMLGAPLWKLLGGMRERVPAFAAGGYYQEGKGLAELQKEFERYREAGFQGAKMNVGGLPLGEDLRRVEAVRAVLGESMVLMLDVNGALTSAKQALGMVDALKPFAIAFVEEPFVMDNLTAIREFYARSRIPVAIGEDESGRWAFAELLSPRSLDILRHDVTLVGGISEWVKVAHLGLAHNLTLFPHWFPEVHIHLAAAFDCMGVELIPPETGIMNFHKLVFNPVAQREGYAAVPDEPGLGLRWNWDVLEKAVKA